MYSTIFDTTDLFCGAGGSSTGAIQAGAEVRLAINHWDRAIETHNRNHPNVTHVLTDISRADPRRYPSTTLLIASPECTNHALAKGKQRKNLGQCRLPGLGEITYDPSEERSRCTMWDPLRFAEVHSYSLVILENVVDARYWVMWDAWLHAWQNLGYEYELVSLNSMFAPPTPQSRDRLYFVAWKRGQRKPGLALRPPAYCPRCQCRVEAVQVWKNPAKRVGKYRQQYVYACPGCDREVVPDYEPAASAIDWACPITRIGDRARPLKPKTLARIEEGLKRFARDPFLVGLNHERVQASSATAQTWPTVTTYDDTGLVTPYPFLVELHGTSTARSLTSPLGTVCAGGEHHGLVTPQPFLIDHVAEYRPRPLDGPMSTIVGGGNHHSLVVPPATPAWILSYYQNGALQPVSEAVPTVTTLPRHALVTADISSQQGEPVRIEDCGFRMLEPHEIQAAMAFPKEYVVTGTRREKVKQLGNAVTPPVMRELVSRCLASLA